MKKEYIKPEVKKLDETSLVKYLKLDEFYHIFRKYSIPQEEQEAQRISFAYGNTKLDNSKITIENIFEAEKYLKGRL